MEVKKEMTNAIRGGTKTRLSTPETEKETRKKSIIM